MRIGGIWTSALSTAVFGLATGAAAEEIYWTEAEGLTSAYLAFHVVDGFLSSSQSTRGDDLVLVTYWNVPYSTNNSDERSAVTRCITVVDQAGRTTSDTCWRPKN